MFLFCARRKNIKKNLSHHEEKVVKVEIFVKMISRKKIFYGPYSAYIYYICNECMNIDITTFRLECCKVLIFSLFCDLFVYFINSFVTYIFFK